jgi:hypothetical protein
MLEGRIGPGNDVMGSRTTDEDYVSLRKSLKKRPLDYFKQDFWADTAAFTAIPATKAGMEFFPIDKIVFASDCPFDPEGGTLFPRVTLEILDSLKMDKTTHDKVFYKNLEAVTGKKLVKGEFIRPLKGGGGERKRAGGVLLPYARKLRGRDPHPSLPLSGGGRKDRVGRARFSHADS